MYFNSFSKTIPGRFNVGLAILLPSISIGMTGPRSGQIVVDPKGRKTLVARCAWQYVSRIRTLWPPRYCVAAN